MTGKKKGAKTGKSSGSGRGCGGGEIQVSDRAGALWRADDLAEDSRTGQTVPLKNLSEKEKRELEESISERITGWLIGYLQQNPGKQKQALACLEDGLSASNGDLLASPDGIGRSRWRDGRVDALSVPEIHRPEPDGDGGSDRCGDGGIRPQRIDIR